MATPQQTPPKNKQCEIKNSDRRRTGRQNPLVIAIGRKDGDDELPEHNFPA
jgi:hypothetical protein